MKLLGCLQGFWIWFLDTASFTRVPCAARTGIAGLYKKGSHSCGLLTTGDGRFTSLGTEGPAGLWENRQEPREVLLQKAAVPPRSCSEGTLCLLNPGHLGRFEVTGKASPACRHFLTCHLCVDLNVSNFSVFFILGERCYWKTRLGVYITLKCTLSPTSTLSSYCAFQI